MKSEILRALREAGDGFVSGQDLCEEAGVTRQAVWKNITQLKEHGFVIESVPNKGYKLVSSPDILYPADIESRLGSGCLFHKAECHDVIDSTNTRAKQLAELGEEEGTLVIAERQTSGKGRRGRQWESGAGTGIYMSMILRPEIEPANVPGITLAAALAVVSAARQSCNVETLVKWPNDIVLGRKKICGILTEMSSEMNYINYVVVGIGINANNEHFQKEIEETATSIYLQTGQKTDRAGLAACIARCFGRYYKEFTRARNLEPFIDEYNSVLANKDQEVKILYGMQEDSSRTETGIARGINKDGALLVDTVHGTECVVSGEVSVRGYMVMYDNTHDKTVVLCASSAYEEKYYFNQEFAGLPGAVKEELQVMCVLYTADVGGILTLQFDDTGNLFINVTSEENDFLFDEIGSVLKIKQIQSEKRELLEALELYYRIKFLDRDIGNPG